MTALAPLSDFPIFSSKIDGNRIVYLDSAATTQKPQSVLDAEQLFYEYSNANVHRAVHALSEKATEAYEGARKAVASFIGADSDEIVFTKNATESINLVARSWGKAHLNKGDLIVLTELEHHSNIVPWQQIAEETGATIEYVPYHARFTLATDRFEGLLEKKPKIVAFTHVSNVLGVQHNVKKMVELARKVGAVTLVDACQSVPHMAVDVKNMDCDFLVFSGHKMLGPMGIGVLYGKKELLDSMPPFLAGGEMIREVTLQKSTWNDVPYKFEAGTPNVAGAVALRAAIDYLRKLGMVNVTGHSKEMAAYAHKRLREMDGVTVFGPEDAYSTLGIVTFVIKGIPAHDAASLLNDKGVMVRSGHHCAMPLHKKLGVESSVRASFYIYNTKEDVDALVDAINYVQEVFKQ